MGLGRKRGHFGCSSLTSASHCTALLLVRRCLISQMLQDAGHAWAQELASRCLSHSMKPCRAPQKPLSLHQGAFLARSFGLCSTCQPLCVYRLLKCNAHCGLARRVPQCQPGSQHLLNTLPHWHRSACRGIWLSRGQLVHRWVTPYSAADKRRTSLRLHSSSWRHSCISPTLASSIWHLSRLQHHGRQPLSAGQAAHATSCSKEPHAFRQADTLAGLLCVRQGWVECKCQGHLLGTLGQHAHPPRCTWLPHVLCHEQTALDQTAACGHCFPAKQKLSCREQKTCMACRRWSCAAVWFCMTPWMPTPHNRCS